MVTHAIPETDSHFTAILSRASAVTHRTSHAALHQQSSFITDRHSPASTRLPNDAGTGLVAFHDRTRAARGSSFLFNRANHNHWTTEHIQAFRMRKPTGSTEKCRQWAFRVYRAPAIQQIILQPYRNVATHSIHVTKQGNGLLVFATFKSMGAGDKVAGIVYTGMQAHLPRLFNQVAGQFPFLT